MNHAAKVGGLVLAFVALFGGAYFVLGQSFFQPKMKRYDAVFADAAGAVAGSAVLLSGVNVGKVERVELRKPGEAVLVLSVKEEVTVPQGTQAIIAASLVGFGDRPIQLEPPTTEQPPLAENGVIPGRVKGALEGIIPDTSATLAEVNETLKATRELITDQELRGKLVAVMDSSNKTITEFGLLAKRLDGMAGQSQAGIQDTLKQANGIMRDFSKTSSAIARMTTDGKLEGKVTGLLDEMTESVKASQGLIADMRATVNDPELKGRMNGILENTETMTESGTRIAADAEKMAANGVVISEKAIGIAEKADAIADKINGLLNKFDETVGGLATKAPSIGPVETDARLIRETGPGRFRGEAEFTLPVAGQKYTIGMWDAFESNKLIAQIGQKLNPAVELRYGVFASQLGLGVHYDVAPGVKLRGDLFDINEPRFDLRSSFRVGGDFAVWLGIDRVFQRNTPSIGLGIRR